jgi:hypothetical protein
VREGDIQSSTSNIRVLPYVARKDDRPASVALTDEELDALDAHRRAATTWPSDRPV